MGIVSNYNKVKERSESLFPDAVVNFGVIRTTAEIGAEYISWLPVELDSVFISSGNKSSFSGYYYELKVICRLKDYENNQLNCVSRCEDIFRSLARYIPFSVPDSPVEILPTIVNKNDEAFYFQSNVLVK